MAKLIPPASTLYFPNAPIIFSSPMPQKTTLTNAIDLLYLYPNSESTYYVVIAATQTILSILLKTPGDYKLIFDWYSDYSSRYIQVQLNSTVISTVYGNNTYNYGTATIYLSKVPANSKLDIIMSSLSSIYCTGIRNVRLQSSPIANVLVTTQVNLSTYSPPLQTATNPSSSYDAAKPMPPPIRSTANYPIRLKDTFVY